MTDTECAHQERTGGCKACKGFHPIGLCSHRDARKISQSYFEDRQKPQAAKRAREGHSGYTLMARNPSWSPARRQLHPQRLAFLRRQLDMKERSQLLQSRSPAKAHQGLIQQGGQRAQAQPPCGGQAGEARNLQRHAARTLRIPRQHHHQAEEGPQHPCAEMERRSSLAEDRQGRALSNWGRYEQMFGRSREVGQVLLYLP